MSRIYEEINTHLLVAILKAQIEILNRLNGPYTLVARPPLKVYTPIEEDNR